MLPDSGVVLLREDGMAAKLTKYSDFWPYYLREHAKLHTRAIHYIGHAMVNPAT